MLPDDDKLVLFDRHRRLMVSMAENVAAATPEQLRELILMLVERAETRDRGLGPVRWTGPARPFFAVVGVAPPDGSGAPVNQRGRGLRRVRMTGPSPGRGHSRVTAAQERQAAEVLQAALVG